MTTFRLHYDDGSSLDVEAETPDQARSIAKSRRGGAVKKIKIVRETVQP